MAANVICKRLENAVALHFQCCTDICKGCLFAKQKEKTLSVPDEDKDKDIELVSPTVAQKSQASCSSMKRKVPNSSLPHPTSPPLSSCPNLASVIIPPHKKVSTSSYLLHAQQLLYFQYLCWFQWWKCW